MSENKQKKKEEKKEDLSKEQEYLMGWQKAVADYQNLQKEMEQQKKDFRKYANEQLILDLIPVIENFKSAAKCIPSEQMEAPWTQGLMYIKQQLLDVLSKEGVKEIPTVGEIFDPTKHEAIAEEDSEKEAGIILKEMQGGYLLHDKVITPAKVVISKEKNN